MSGRAELLSLGDKALLAQCEVDVYRASGPGGQKRNKTSSAVRLRHRPTGLSVTAHESRSQALNRRLALRKLRTSIALDLRESAPGDAAQLEAIARFVRLGPTRRSARTSRPESHLVVMAQLLDVLEAHGAGLASAAEALGISTASLGKAIKRDTQLVRRVAAMRARLGLKPLQ